MEGNKTDSNVAECTESINVLHNTETIELEPSKHQQALTPTENELDPDKLPESLKSNWVLVVVLIVAETESASQLSLPSVVTSMGFVPGAIFLIFFGIMAMFTGFLIADIWKLHPSVRNYDEVIGIHFGKVAKEIALWCQVVLLWCFVAANIMVSAQALYIAANEKVCYVVFSIVVTLLGILISVPRTLKGVAYLSFSCIVFVAVPEIMTLTGVAVQNVPAAQLRVGTSSNASAFAITNLVNFFVAISDIVFAYSGHLLFFNLIIEMGNPNDFKKAVFWAFLINIINYLIIGLGIYAYTGIYSQSPYILNLITSSVRKTAYLLEVINVLVSAMNYSHLSAKNIFRRFPRFKGLVYKKGLKYWFGWLLALAVMWLIPWIASELIPVFNNLIGLAGALLASQFTYILPCILWIHSNWTDVRCGKYFWKTCWLSLIIVIGFISLGLGTYSSIDGIIQLRQQGAIPAPFSCRELS